MTNKIENHCTINLSYDKIKRMLQVNQENTNGHIKAILEKIKGLDFESIDDFIYEINSY